MPNWLFRLKKALRLWLDVESAEDAYVRRKHLHGRVDLISQHQAELLARMDRETTECLKVHRFCTMTAIAWELERDNIEAGYLPCGCVSEQDHKTSGGRGHSENLMRRVERWLIWRKNERE